MRLADTRSIAAHTHLIDVNCYECTSLQWQSCTWALLWQAKVLCTITIKERYPTVEGSNTDFGHRNLTKQFQAMTHDNVTSKVDLWLLACYYAATSVRLNVYILRYGSWLARVSDMVFTVLRLILNFVQIAALVKPAGPAQPSYVFALCDPVTLTFVSQQSRECPQQNWSRSLQYFSS